MISYPVRAAGDGTERIVDAAGHVLGTVEIVEALNRGHEPGHVMVRFRRTDSQPLPIE